MTARPVRLPTGRLAQLHTEDLAQMGGKWGFDHRELACSGDHSHAASAGTDLAALSGATIGGRHRAAEVREAPVGSSEGGKPTEIMSRASYREDGEGIRL